MNSNNILDQPINDDNYLEAEEFQLASAGQRFANYLIDMVIVYALFFVTIVIIALSGSAISEDNTFMIYIIYFSVFFPYYLFFEGIFGNSIGKLITGTKVVDEDGYKISFAHALGRTFCRLIPFDAFSFFSSDPIGWHDSISGTRVVKKN